MEKNNSKCDIFVIASYGGHWDELMKAKSAYNPRAIKINEDIADDDGTTINK